MTAHINAKENEIAKTVIMPGDPKRAEFIANKYLDNYEIVSTVRGNNIYTGTYKGKEVTVMASGMGMPSIGIYSYELYKFYDVDTIIRIGTAGAFTKELNLFDVILADTVYTDSSYAKVQSNLDYTSIKSNYEVNNKILETSNKLNENVKLANIYSSDVFYKEKFDYEYLFSNNIKATEMEGFALLHTASILNKKAACLLTISNNFETNEETSSLEREQKLDNMIKLCLESIR